jgi:methionyl aminopeptidase
MKKVMADKEMQNRLLFRPMIPACWSGCYGDHAHRYFQEPTPPMTIKIKSPEEIEKMRVAGRLAAEVLTMIEPYVKPGVTTGELDRLCHDYIVNVQQAIPAPLNYHGFPKSICTSVNHQVCHGIPGDKVLKSGDIVNVDITVIKDGYHGDTSKMFYIGEPSILARRITEASYECLRLGIEMVKPGKRLGDIGHIIQSYAEGLGFSVVREYCGHGIGLEFHEEPQVVHYGKPDTGEELRPGMIFTIEPMINVGKRHVKLLPDQWTVVTKDRSLSAQWEHTILVTERGHEILTLRPEETLS